MQNLIKVLILLSLIMIIVISAWVIIKKYYLFELVHNGIEERIRGQIENEYEFTLRDFKINWFSRQIQLSGFDLLLLHQSDTVGYYKGDVEIKVDGWINIFFERHKRVNNIILNNADLYYASDYPFKLKEKQSNYDPTLEVAKTNVRGKLIYADRHKKRDGSLYTEFDLALDLNYKSIEKLDLNHLVERITTFNLNQFHYYFKDGFYQLMVEDVTISRINILIPKIIDYEYELHFHFTS